MACNFLSHIVTFFVLTNLQLSFAQRCCVQLKDWKTLSRSTVNDLIQACASGIFTDMVKEFPKKENNELFSMIGHSISVDGAISKRSSLVSNKSSVSSALYEKENFQRVPENLSAFTTLGDIVQNIANDLYQADNMSMAAGGKAVSQSDLPSTNPSPPGENQDQKKNNADEKDGKIGATDLFKESYEGSDGGKNNTDVNTNGTINGNNKTGDDANTNGRNLQHTTEKVMDKPPATTLTRASNNATILITEFDNGRRVVTNTSKNELINPVVDPLGLIGSNSQNTDSSNNNASSPASTGADIFPQTQGNVNTEANSKNSNNLRICLFRKPNGTLVPSSTNISNSNIGVAFQPNMDRAVGPDTTNLENSTVAVLKPSVFNETASLISADRPLVSLNATNDTRNEDAKNSNDYFVGPLKECKANCREGVCDVIPPANVVWEWTGYKLTKFDDMMSICIPQRAYNFRRSCYGDKSTDHILFKMLAQKKFRRKRVHAYIAQIVSLYGGFFPDSSRIVDGSYMTKNLDAFMSLIQQSGNTLKTQDIASAKQRLKLISDDFVRIFREARYMGKREIYRELLDEIRDKLMTLELGQYQQTLLDALQCQILNQDKKEGL